MRTSRIAKILVALALLVACNAAINYALEPYGSISEIEWTEYRQLEKLDTVIIGSSYIQQGLDPIQMDEAAGTASMCMGTPQQRLEESFVGIRTAYNDHHIERVILGVSPSAFTDSAPPSPNSAYLKAWRKTAGLDEVASVTADILLRQGAIATEESINCLFPWKNYHVTLRPANIMENLRNKVGQIDLVEAASTIEKDWVYQGRGHGVSNYRLDLNWGAAVPFDTMIGNDLDKIDGRMVAPDRERTLREICAYCTERGIQMMVVVPPMPTFNILDEESHYTGIMDAIAAIAADYDVPLYDFNYLDTRYFVPDPALFADTAHLNAEGCKAFTDVFGRFLGDLMAGKSVEGYFVDREQAISGMDYVSALFAEGASVGDGIAVDCRAVGGPGVKAEYRLCRFVGEDYDSAQWNDPYEDVANWEVVSEWSSDPHLVYAPEAPGTYILRAQARKIGSELEFDRYRDVTVVY